MIGGIDEVRIFLPVALSVEMETLRPQQHPK
jgi:hypothetical protein